MNADILIIDDNPDNLNLLIALLREVGFKTRPARSGSVGLRAAEETAPDLILLDIRMPGLDGFEVCRRFKANAALAEIPIIFISAEDDTEAKVNAFRLGAVDYISKPFQHAEVLARVHKELKLYKALKQARELAALEERQRIARELHDAVNQTLFSLSIAAETTLLQHRKDPTRTEDGLVEIRQRAKEAIAEMRVLMYALRPASLSDSNFGELVHTLARTLAGRTGAEVGVRCAVQTILPPDVQITLYRIVQEALSNVIKHAEATHIIVEVVERDRYLTVRIADDGRGFDPERTPSGRFGLANMKARALEIDARWSLRTHPDEGTEIILEVDL